MKKALFSNLLLALFLIGLDFATKQAALLWVPPLRGVSFPFGGIPLFEKVLGVSFSLNLVANSGVAWGLFAGYPAILLCLRVLIISALVALSVIRSKKGPGATALWLIVAGALGNVIDMLRFGTVIDFFHFQFFGWSFPLFNIADSCITVGACLMLFLPRRKAVLEG